MTKHLVSGYFPAPGGGDWDTFAAVLRHTAEQQCPSWQIHIDRIEPTRMSSALGVPDLVWNTQKMEHWNRVIQEMADDELVALLDADTMILRPLDDVWERDFDIAYTARPSAYRFPLNSGVVFVRVSPAARTFFELWWQENDRMLREPRYHDDWRHKYGGINQAALCYVLERCDTWGAQLVALKCREWNCEDSTWEVFDPAITRIVHLKGALRSAVTGYPAAGVSVPGVPQLAALWQSFAKKATVGVPV